MNPLPLIRVAGLRPFAAFLQRIGAPVQRLMASAGLPLRVLDDAEALIPARRAFRFMEDAARAEGIEDLGLLVGRATPLDGLGVFGRLVRQSLTLRDALDTMLRALPAFTSGERYWLARRGEELCLCHTFVDGLGVGCGQADQFALMLALGVLRLAAGSCWQPAYAELETPSPGRLPSVECLAGTRIAFAQPATAVAFPRALLLRPLPLAAAEVGVRVHDLQAWMASGPAHDLPGSVQQVVETLSWAGYPSIPATAHVVGMSVRSLQRRLADAGISYEGLVARARFAAAVDLLEETNAKILDIAFDLGYADHAHFSRAFRRWTGTSPREFRRRSRRLPDGARRAGAARAVDGAAAPGGARFVRKPAMLIEPRGRRAAARSGRRGTIAADRRARD